MGGPGSLDKGWLQFLEYIETGFDSSGVSADEDGSTMEMQKFMIAAIEILEDHNHGVQKSAPEGADPIVVTAGGGAWTLGNFSNDLLAPAAVAVQFDIHHVIISAPDTNEDYELVLYGDAVEIARVPFTRSNNFVNSIQLPIMTPLLDAGTQIRAKLADGTGGAVCGVKIMYHEY